MIVIAGIETEEPVALAIEAARTENIDHVVMHLRDADQFGLDITFTESGWVGELDVAGQRVNVADVTGIYSRLAEPATMPKQFGAGDEKVARSRAVQLMIAEWIETADCTVANRATAMASNGSKPYQAQVIESCGFRTPTTIITTDPTAAKAFIDTHRGETIYKSVSGIRSIVRRVDAEAMARLDRIRSAPTQFQELVPGTDLRVHVVGDEVLPIEIASSAIDYRYAGRDGLAAELTPCSLPDEVAERCRQLSRRLALPFCGIDLRRTPDGEFVCFEVNPSPAYSYYQHHTGQPIARALVHYLANREMGSARAA